MSVTEKSFELTGLFEAELLLELMLRYWEHPLADNKEYRDDLLECAALVLRSSINGEQFHPNLQPEEVNLVAAIWIAESKSIATVPPHSESEALARAEWLAKIRKCLPSCFCNQDALD